MNAGTGRGGLGEQTISIQKLLNPNCQKLFFSATFSDEIMRFCKATLKTSKIVRLKDTSSLVLTKIYQVRLPVSQRRGGNRADNLKVLILKDIYELFNVGQSIVFVETKEEASKVAAMFTDVSYKVSVTHSSLSPSQRDDEFRKFRRNETTVLVTTNVLAKGIDVPAVDIVVHYDLPVLSTGRNGPLVADAETYIHRNGRIRAKGTSIALLQYPQDETILLAIERHYGFDQNRRMTEEWDPNQIDTLAEKVEEKMSESDVKTNGPGDVNSGLGAGGGGVAVEVFDLH